jgi:hypothetical protein
MCNEKTMMYPELIIDMNSIGVVGNKGLSCTGLTLHDHDYDAGSDNHYLPAFESCCCRVVAPAVCFPSVLHIYKSTKCQEDNTDSRITLSYIWSL